MNANNSVEHIATTPAEHGVFPEKNGDQFSNPLPRLCEILIEDMAQLFNIYPLNTAVIMAKQNWPQYRFIYCSENDMAEKEPYKVFDKFSFFLISASLGCATLTNVPSKSVGLIIAEHESD